jgi:Na+/H+ antiporter NhaC
VLCCCFFRFVDNVNDVLILFSIWFSIFLLVQTPLRPQLAKFLSNILSIALKEKKKKKKKINKKIIIIKKNYVKTIDVATLFFFSQNPLH